MLNKVALTANIGVGVDALRIHPLRTILSVLGIIIGSASLVATMAISDGIMEFARGEITQETSVQPDLGIWQEAKTSKRIMTRRSSIPVVFILWLAAAIALPAQNPKFDAELARLLKAATAAQEAIGVKDPMGPGPEPLLQKYSAAVLQPVTVQKVPPGEVYGSWSQAGSRRV